MILISQKTVGLAAALLLALAVPAAGGDASPSQRGYNLFKPVPQGMLRPLAADRPDATESPQTVDAGHLQLEDGILRPTLHGLAVADRLVVEFRLK